MTIQGVAGYVFFLFSKTEQASLIARLKNRVLRFL
jgi:hypothetical protein